MHAMLLHNEMVAFRRRESGSSSGMGCFVVLLVIGVVIYFVMKGRRDKGEQLGASHRPMGSGPVEGNSFSCPYPKCPNCGAPGDKMKSTWDGMRKVTWNCGYCSTQAGVQELKDEELPASARQRLGLDAPAVAPGQPGYYPPQQGGMGGVGGLLTGMMIGGMMGGSGHHHRDGDGDSSGSSDSSDSSGSDWGDSGSGGSDWGDSGGDAGGGDSGGGDW
jgi:hypothetical protein